MHSACMNKGKAYLQTGVDSSRHNMVTCMDSWGAVCLAAVENVINRKMTVFDCIPAFSLILVADIESTKDFVLCIKETEWWVYYCVCMCLCVLYIVSVYILLAWQQFIYRHSCCQVQDMYWIVADPQPNTSAFTDLAPGYRKCMVSSGYRDSEWPYVSLYYLFYLISKSNWVAEPQLNANQCTARLNLHSQLLYQRLFQVWKFNFL